MSLLLLFAGARRFVGRIARPAKTRRYDPRELEKELLQRRKDTFSRQTFNELLAEREAQLKAELRAAELARDQARQAALDAQIAAVEALKAQLLAPKPGFIAAPPILIQLQQLIDSQAITRAKLNADDEDEAIALLLLH